MMFTADDFRIDSIEDLMEFAPILVFVGFVAPFLILAYTIGFVLDVTGLLD